MWKHFAMQLFSNMSYGCSQHLKKDNSHLFWIKVDCLQEFGIYESSWCISAWQWCLHEQMIGLGDRRMIIIYIYLYPTAMCCWKRLHSKSHQLSSGWQMRIFKPMTFTFVYFLCCSSSCLLSWRRIHNEYFFPLKRRRILWSAESPNKVGEGGTKMPAHVTRHHVATRAAFISRLLARLTLTQRAVTE